MVETDTLVLCELRILPGLALVGVKVPINDCNIVVSSELCVDLIDRTSLSEGAFSILLLVEDDNADDADKTSMDLSLLVFMGDGTDDVDGKLVVDPATDELSNLTL